MRSHLTILLVICLVVTKLQAQSPASQSFVFAGYPAAGFDYAKKISHKKWSSGVLSVAASPQFYFRRYNFDFGSYTSKFSNYRMLMPVVLRVDFYPNQILLSELGKKKRQLGLFFDAGYCMSYNLKTHLTENFYTSTSGAAAFSYNGDVAANESKISFHPTIGFGIKVSRVVFVFRTILRPYHWKDLSKEWNLPDNKVSYFYSWEYSQPGVMICFGYKL